METLIPESLQRIEMNEIEIMVVENETTFIQECLMIITSLKPCLPWAFIWIVSYEFIILGKADEEPEKINNFKNILLFVLEILTSVIVVLKRHIRDIMSLTCHDIM